MAYDPQNPKGHYDTSTTVPESVIEEIRQLGMEQAIKQARSGQASPEFVEGVRRFYPAAIEDIEASQPEQAAPPRGDIADPPKIPTDDFATEGAVGNVPPPEVAPAASSGPPSIPGGLEALQRRQTGAGGAEGQMTGSKSPYAAPGAEPRERQGILGDLGLSPDNASSFPDRLKEATGNVFGRDVQGDYSVPNSGGGGEGGGITDLLNRLFGRNVKGDYSSR